MVIGISDTFNKKIDFYTSWVRKVAPDAEIRELSYLANNARELKKCDGLILTGGHDIHPRFYGREDYLAVLKKENMNELRDEFEIKIIKDAVKAQLPVLGICRGLQIFNVALGGSMIPDLESEGYKNHAKSKAGKDGRHKVEIDKQTTLRWIVESSKADVNSAHHQAVDVIAPGLRVTAKSPDAVVEGLEWSNADGKPFLQLVQWHPERIEDYSNPCSKNLLEHFVLAVVSRAEE